MNAIQRNGGTAGIVAAILFLILLGASSSYDPGTFNDPAKALASATEQRALRIAVGAATVLAGVALVFFYAGLSARLAERAPTRSAATLNFGLVGAAALGLGALVDWIGLSYLAGYAAKDQTAAQHAWVALTAINTGVYGLAGAFLAAATILASWAIIATGLLRPAAGWIGILAAVVAIIGLVGQSVLPPESSTIFVAYMAAGILFLIWFAWVGRELRRA